MTAVFEIHITVKFPRMQLKRRFSEKFMYSYVLIMSRQEVFFFNKLITQQPFDRKQKEESGVTNQINEASVVYKHGASVNVIGHVCVSLLFYVRMGAVKWVCQLEKTFYDKKIIFSDYLHTHLIKAQSQAPHLIRQGAKRL